jgi:hypothetical protein
MTRVSATDADVLRFLVWWCATPADDHPCPFDSDLFWLAVDRDLITQQGPWQDAEERAHTWFIHGGPPPWSISTKGARWVQAQLLAPATVAAPCEGCSEVVETTVAADPSRPMCLSCEVGRQFMIASLLRAANVEVEEKPMPAFELAPGCMSSCGRYRYTLSRVSNEGSGRVCWVMLNPSTADHEQDDPTIRRVKGFTARLGFRELVVVNLFAWRATDPADMLRAADPIGPRNDQEILRAAEGSEIVIAAWGPHGARHHRDREVALMLARAGVSLACLGTTKAGHPRHPLMLRADAGVQPFSVPG